MKIKNKLRKNVTKKTSDVCWKLTKVKRCTISLRCLELLFFSIATLTNIFLAENLNPKTVDALLSVQIISTRSFREGVRLYFADVLCLCYTTSELLRKRVGNQ